MSIISLASGESAWKGYNYFKEGKVIFVEKNGENEFVAAVNGSESNVYAVEFYTEHPRKSSCDCPHANGKRIFCKHIVAAFFAAFPSEAEKYYNEVIEYEREEEKRQAELENKLIKYVGKMTKAELKETLLELLFYGPEWQYDIFIRDHIK